MAGKSETYVAGHRPLNAYERDIASITFIRSVATLTKRARTTTVPR